MTAGDAGPDERLFRRWGHSFEEDHDDVRVYRPADYDFPRARGRDGIEFRPDGSFVEWAIGRGDAPEPRPGTWRPIGADLTVAGAADTGSRTLRVVSVDDDRLEIRTEFTG